jgi:predicted dinucleotide-binding enzyme
MPKRVGVIGSGPVGQKLASAFSSTGYETRISSRTPDKLREFIAQNKGKISSGTFDQVSVFGEILVLATHGEATENACDIAGAKNFSHKVVIDASNPLDF